MLTMTAAYVIEIDNAIQLERIRRDKKEDSSVNTKKVWLTLGDLPQDLPRVCKTVVEFPFVGTKLPEFRVPEPPRVGLIDARDHRK